MRDFMRLYAGPLTLVGVILAALLFFLRTPSETSLTRIYIRDIPVQVRIADTPALRTQGLSGTSKLLSSEGMLFLFPQEGFYSIWMKEMKFSIDVLWLASDGTIVHALQALSPETYPHVFTSTLPAKYVLELSSGFMERNGIMVGDKIDL